MCRHIKYTISHHSRQYIVKAIKEIRGKSGVLEKARDSVSWRRTGIMADFVNEVTSRPALSDGWDLKKWAWRRRELENVNMKKAV